MCASWYLNCRFVLISPRSINMHIMLEHPPDVLILSSVLFANAEFHGRLYLVGCGLDGGSLDDDT